MRILIVSTVPFNFNGIASVIMNYYRSMNKKELQFDFVVVDEITDEFKNEIERNSSRIFCLSRGKNPIKYMRCLYKIIKLYNYNIVHVHGNSATMAIDLLPARIAEVPIRIAHSHNTTCSHKKLHKLLYPIFENLMTHGFSCGNDAGKWLFKDKPFNVIKNGIDLNEFIYDEQIRNKYREKVNAGNKIVVGHVGNFVKQKNHEFIVKIMNELSRISPEYIFLLIGFGELYTEIKDIIHHLNLDDKVVFVGKTTEVNKYLQAMDLFILPSLHEGLPLVLVEAQASGLPCLVSESVSSETKLSNLINFMPINDAKDWAKWIYSSTECWNDERMIKMGKAHINIINEGYDITNSANHMKDLYQEYIIKSKFINKN